MIGKYGSWSIQESQNGADAVAVSGGSGTVFTIPLYRNHHVAYEGWFNPSGAPTVGTAAIAGVCLYDRSWFVEFEQKDRSNPPGRKSPALESERFKILERLEKGDRIVRMGVPIGPQRYHRDLIAWQGDSVRMLGRTGVFYHIPTREYHYYISEIEHAAGIDFPQVHDHLDAFSAEIEGLVRKSLEGVTVHFLDPFPLGHGDPYGSYLLPYLKPELFGIQPDRVIGIENLVETTLAHMAACRGGPQIPVFASVIALPNPYFEKGDGTNVIVLELGE